MLFVPPLIFLTVPGLNCDAAWLLLLHSPINQVLIPAQNYFLEIRNMFASKEYKQATDRREKKDIVGNTIYKHVEKLIGE